MPNIENKKMVFKKIPVGANRKRRRIMPKTIPGKLSVVMLLVLVIHLLSIVIMLFENGLGAIIIVMYLIATAPLGMVFGIIGIIKETGNSLLLPWVTTIVSLLLLVLFFITLFGYSFGG